MIGLTLEGNSGSPVVKGTAKGGKAFLSNRLTPGRKVLEVNGQAVEGHEQATAIIKAASGELTFKLAPVSEADVTS